MQQAHVGHVVTDASNAHLKSSR